MNKNKSFQKKLGVSPEAFGVFADVFFGGKSLDKALDDQQEQAQETFSNSGTLPLVGTEDRKPWEAMGFKFTDEKDNLFVRVDMPEGWKFGKQEGGYHSYLLDDQGRSRAYMFYKGAFYDQDAFIRLKTRYSINNRSSKLEDSEVKGFVEDNNFDPPQILFTTTTPKTDKYYGDQDKVKEQCEKWLKKNYPKWQDPTSYW
jgi:hypothetical protein